MAILFDEHFQAMDASGTPISGAQLFFYRAGTSTLVTVYQDADATTPHTNPVLADSAGLFPPIYADFSAFALKTILKDASGVTIQTVDDIDKSVTFGNLSTSLVQTDEDPLDLTADDEIPTVKRVATMVGDSITGSETAKTDDYTIVEADGGKTITANKATAITFTLPAVATVGAGYQVRVANIGAGTLTVDGNGAETINGETTIDLDQYTSAVLWTDGTAWRSSSVSLAAISSQAKADFRYVDPNGPRIPVEYYDATRVQIVGVRSIAMGGFRFRGRYKVGRAPVFDMPAFTDAERHIIDLGDGATTAGDLFAEAYHSKETWYAQFAAANDGDPTATLGSMPFLRVGSIAGNVVTFNPTGENDRTVSGKTYQFTNDALVGCDVLAITETLDSRANAFSGRLTTVTANTQTTVTLADVGTMGEFDFFLIAPPGFDHYCYLNTFFMDTAEIRNIADDGYLVGSRGVDNTQASYSGELLAAVQIPCDGHVSPLATGVEFDHNEAVASAATGFGSAKYGLDGSSHDYFLTQWNKTEATTMAWTMHVNARPFAGYYGQSVFIYPSGAFNNSNNTRKMQVRGWLEP